MTDKEKAFLYGGAIAVAVALYYLWKRNPNIVSTIINEAPFSIPALNSQNPLVQFGDYVMSQLPGYKGIDIPPLSETASGYNADENGSCSLCMTHEQSIIQPASVPASIPIYVPPTVVRRTIGNSAYGFNSVPANPVGNRRFKTV